MSRSESTISAALAEYQAAHHTKLRDFTPLSVLTALNGAIASQIKYIEDQNDAMGTALSIWTADEGCLDLLIRDRLLGGRYAGDYATGTLLFYRRSAAGSDFTIRAGTRVLCPTDQDVSIVFVTTEAATLVAGTKSISVAARCLDRGSSGNVTTGTINKMEEAITGIEGVTNTSPFAGGTDAETDEELRQRYIDTATLPGTATITMLEAKLSDIDTVRESKVWTRGESDIEVICDDTEGIVDDSETIDDCLLENVAAGAVSRGVLAATLGASPTYDIGDAYGGRIWVRAKEHITPNLDFAITYTDMAAQSRTATVVTTETIPRGTAFLATLQDPDDRAVSVQSSDDDGSLEMDVLIGMGTYPRLYNLPEIVTVDVDIELRLTETPEADLELHVEESILAFLNSFRIGISMDWSDLLKVTNNVFIEQAVDGDVETGEVFHGIDAIIALSATDGDAQTADTLNTVIDVEDDARIEAGEVTFSYV